ncbi:uncharacterized protein LOC112272062 [Brachypodium distachyon]|uniref:uncharacterized protein LOC112272062 n=1 Tax=Brachypodium distachyon TaxID=15368 RepID=UPI000D0CD087|nr:uncharacterized protein LOC112272062 [Brachypodium distachyon]|eukprot:XP_024318418.1 uncharacterized protein LOC112272062 [Brachypodium distachyon]
MRSMALGLVASDTYSISKQRCKRDLRASLLRSIHKLRMVRFTFTDFLFDVDVECAFEGDAQTSPGPVKGSQAAVGTPIRGTFALPLHCSPGPVTRSQAALRTPVRDTSALAALQASPGPVTRRKLALAVASDGASGTPNSPQRPVVTAAKKITPKRKRRS